jgi:hypothetical protein
VTEVNHKEPQLVEPAPGSCIEARIRLILCRSTSLYRTSWRRVAGVQADVTCCVNVASLRLDKNSGRSLSRKLVHGRMALCFNGPYFCITRLKVQLLSDRNGKEDDPTGRLENLSPPKIYYLYNLCLTYLFYLTTLSQQYW